jgi:cell wall-associated NlpC family hydrolase
MDVEMISKLSKYIGIPCVHGSNDGGGMSCLALAHNVLREYGISTPAMEYLDLPEDWWRVYPHLIEQKLVEMGGSDVNDIDALQPADIVLFSTVDGQDTITHIGVMIDNVRFIHALINTRSKVSKITSRFWRYKLKRVIRVR